MVGNPFRLAENYSILKYPETAALELDEVTGLLPQGSWVPSSDEELSVTSEYDRIARVNMVLFLHELDVPTSIRPQGSEPIVL